MVVVGSQCRLKSMLPDLSPTAAQQGLPALQQQCGARAALPLPSAGRGDGSPPPKGIAGSDFLGEQEVLRRGLPGALWAQRNKRPRVRPSVCIALQPLAPNPGAGWDPRGGTAGTLPALWGKKERGPVCQTGTYGGARAGGFLQARASFNKAVSVLLPVFLPVRWGGCVCVCV